MTNGVGRVSQRLWRAIKTRFAEAMRHRESIRFPVEGIVFFGVTLLIGIAAMNTSAQLLFLVFSMMCAFCVLSAITANWNRRKLDARRIAPRVVPAMTPVRVRIRISSRKRVFTSYSLRVTDWVRDRPKGGDLVPAGAVFVARVSPKGEETREYECVFPRRGVFLFDRITIASRYPFGLIEHRLMRTVPQEILVLPATIAVEGFVRTRRTDLGDVELHAKGRSMGLYGIREYTHGDSARDIHWKLTARQGKLLVREHESEERRRASVILDNRLPEDAGAADRERLERAIVLASSLLVYLAEHGHQIELLTSSGKVAFGQGPQHLLRCRRALALLDPAAPSALPPHAHVAEADSVQIAVLHRPGEEAAGESIGIGIEEFRAELDGVLARVVEVPATDPATLDDEEAG